MGRSGPPVRSARMEVGQPECMLPRLHIAGRIETRCQDFANKGKSGLAKWGESSSKVYVQTDVCRRCACASLAVPFHTPRNQTRAQNKGRGAGLVFERGPCPARLGLCREPVPLKSAVLLLRIRTAGARAVAICEVLQTRRRNPNLIELVAEMSHGTRTRVFRIWFAIWRIWHQI